MTTLPRLSSNSAPAVILPLAITTLWGGGILWFALNDGFVQSVGGLPSKLLIAFTCPVILFALVYRFSLRLKAWVASLDIALVIAAQTWRVLGILFVALWALGSLPAAFALPAGLGDTAVGIFAAFVTLAAARKTNGWQGRVRLLVIFGILDFAVAFATATLSGKGRLLQFAGEPLPVLMQVEPMVMIPAFGVPLFMICHFITWVKLYEPQNQPRGN